jgi:hypothetical protein
MVVVYKIVHHSPLRIAFPPKSDSILQLHTSLPLIRHFTSRSFHSSPLRASLTPQSPIPRARMPGHNDCTAISPSRTLDQNNLWLLPFATGNTFFPAVFAVLTLSNLLLGLRFRTCIYILAMFFGLPWRSNWLPWSRPSPLEPLLRRRL